MSNPDPGAYRAPTPATVPGFHGVPTRDYVTDVVAALLLLSSLGLPWNLATQATAHLEVILLTVLSVLSLAVHYLYRVGALPPGWSSRTVARVRALVNAPYLVLVVVAVVLDLVSVLGRSATITPGVGSAAVVGLAGACLAALPRAGETDAAFAAVQAARFRPLFAGLAGAAVLFQVLGLVAPAVTDVYSYLGGSFVTVLVVASIAVAVLTAWGLVALARGDDAWRPVVVATGTTMVLWVLLFGRQYVLSAGSANLALVALAVAAPCALTPSEWRTGGPDRRGYGHAAAGNALLYVVVLAATAVASEVALLTAGGFLPTPTVVTILVLSLVSGVAAVIGRAALTGPTMTPTAVTLGVIVLIGVVVIAVEGASDGLGVAWTDGLAFGLPLTAAWALALPGRNTTLVQAFNGPARPAQAPAHGFTARQAADPATDPSVLARIAAEAPELRASLATNPATYPALLTWLADLHEPAVDAALATRQG